MFLFSTEERKSNSISRVGSRKKVTYFELIFIDDLILSMVKLLQIAINN